MMFLQRRGEGQWLISGLSEKDRWDPNKEVDYRSVKAAWLARYQKKKRTKPHIEVVIEKSPSNMMRMEELASQFVDYSFIANNRDPYAFCASSLYRRRCDTDNLSSAERKTILTTKANHWLMRSRVMKKLIQKLNIPLLTYENFCQNPSSVLDILNLPKGAAETIDPDAKVKVKDYDKQKIINQNDRQISKLTDDDIEHVRRVLEPSADLLEYFGYQIERF